MEMMAVVVVARQPGGRVEGREDLKVHLVHDQTCFHAGVILNAGFVFNDETGLSRLAGDDTYTLVDSSLP